MEKNTRMALFNFEFGRNLNGHFCEGKQNVCSFSQQKHLVLSGTAPGGGFYANMGKEYPSRLCKLYMECLVGQFESHLLLQTRTAWKG